MDASPDASSSLIRRLWGWARRHWIITTIGVGAAIGLGIWLIFFFFAVQTLFIDEEVDEALPTFGAPAAPAEAPPAAAPPPSGSETAAPAPAGQADTTATAPAPDGQATPAPPAPAAAEGTEAPPPPAAETTDAAPAAETDHETPVPTPDPPPETAAATEPAPAEAQLVAGPGASGMPGDEITQERADAMNEMMASGEMPAEDPVAPAEQERPMPVAPEIVTLVSGEFMSRSHPTEGRVLVLNDGSEQRFLRFENFRTDNGPDLNVWLSSAPPDAPVRDFLNDWIDLGDLKGNVGAQNYEIPPSVDLDRYSTVLVWCVRFSVVFGSAGLA